MLKNAWFGVEIYAPAAIFTLSARYTVKPVAKECTVIKNEVFGGLLYAPASIWTSLPRYDVKPEPNE